MAPGSPFFLEVIRHYHAPQDKFASELTEAEEEAIEESQYQRGVLWGTLWTAQGSVNVIGLSMSFAPGQTAGGADIPTQGILPVINHDALMAAYMPVNPITGSAGLQFALLGELGTGVFCDELLPGDCIWCVPGPGVWCPCDDPDVQLAADALALCLAGCAAILAYQVGAAGINALANAVRSCLLAAPLGPAFLACLAVHALAFALLYAIALRTYALCTSGCTIAFGLVYNNALANACGP